MSVRCPQQAGRKRERDHFYDATCYRLRVNQIPIKLEAHDGGPNGEEWSSVDDHSRPTGSPKCDGPEERRCFDSSLS